MKQKTKDYIKEGWLGFYLIGVGIIIIFMIGTALFVAGFGFHNLDIILLNALTIAIILVVGGSIETTLAKIKLQLKELKQ